MQNCSNMSSCRRAPVAQSVTLNLSDGILIDTEASAEGLRGPFHSRSSLCDRTLCNYDADLSADGWRQKRNVSFKLIDALCDEI